MLRKTGLQPTKGIIQTATKGKKRSAGVHKNDHEQPLDPITRMLHEPGFNIYIVAIIGMKTPIDSDIIKAYGVHVINQNYRFSSLQVLNKENGSMRWVPTHVNLDNHVIVPELDPNMKSSDKFVEDYILNLSRSHIDYSKPLWDLHILNTKTLDEQGGTCIFCFYHPLGDGISLINLLLYCSRKASDVEARPTLLGVKVPIECGTSFRSKIAILWNLIVALVMFILTIFFLKDTQMSLKGVPGIEDRPRRFVRTHVSLDDIKMVKNAMDVTVNEVLVGVIQAGLYRYLHRRYGENNNSVPMNIRVRGLVAFNMRASTMINVNTPGKMGSEVGYLLFPFNVKNPQDPLLENVREVKNAMERKKASLEPFWRCFRTRVD